MTESDKKSLAAIAALLEKKLVEPQQALEVAFGLGKVAGLWEGFGIGEEKLQTLKEVA